MDSNHLFNVSDYNQVRLRRGKGKGVRPLFLTWAKKLAASLIATHAVPNTEPRDALHIAIAATNGIQYLATWSLQNEAIP